MLSQKAIEAKISDLEVKLDGLYKQIDPVCTVFKSSERAGAKSVNSFASSKGRGRPPKEGVEKLIELQNKLKNQTKKTEEELEKITQGISKQVKDLNAEIEQRKTIVGKTLNTISKIKQPKTRRLREQRAVNYNEQNDNSQHSSLIIRTRNSRGRFISLRGSGSGVASRLRMKNSIVSANQEVIKTRSALNFHKSVSK
jgi:seryl-tRNA synthetase